MGLYDDAVEEMESGIYLIDSGKYRQAVFHFCLATELFLKSKLLVIDRNSSLEFSHDTVGMYQQLRLKYKPLKDLLAKVTLCRKYFNESRYPHSDRSVYTRDFAEKLLFNVREVKSYIDNECQTPLEDLEKNFTGSKK